MCSLFASGSREQTPCTTCLVVLHPNSPGEVCLETVPIMGEPTIKLLKSRSHSPYKLSSSGAKLVECPPKAVPYIHGKAFQMADGEYSGCGFRQVDVEFRNELIQLLSWHLMRQCFTTDALSRISWIRALQSECYCCAGIRLELWVILPWLYLRKRGDCDTNKLNCLIFTMGYNFNCTPSRHH